VTEAVRQQLLGQQADSTSSSSSHSILKRAVWRRQLTRECSHYLAPILGKDAAGSVLLVGECCELGVVCWGGAQGPVLLCRQARVQVCSHTECAVSPSEGAF
jgi:hypothetical protein